MVAVLVLETVSQEAGVWVRPKVLGASTEEEKKRAQKFFRSKKSYIHICLQDQEGTCLEQDKEGLHLGEFEWFPPGDFDAPWLNRQARKAVQEGPGMSLEEEKKIEGESANRAGGGPPGDGPPSSVLERLENLRRPSALRVRFAGDTAPRNTEAGAGSRRDVSVGGPGGRAEGSTSLVARTPQTTRVKTEVINLDSETEEKPKKSLGRSLAAAALSQAKGPQDKKRRRKRRSRSRSKGRKDKKKRRRSSSPDSSDDQGSEESSSSESLLPPLKKKAMKTPGSVFRMLEEHATQRLAQDATLEENQASSGSTGLRGKFHTFFLLCLKPQMDPKSRDTKELFLLSRSLDLLRQGQLEQLADALASRMMAVETASKQGWGTAKYLEVLDEGDETSAPAHVLLAAQRHGRLVEKAGGKGSWTRQQANCYGEMSYGQQTKGKAKDGKGKGKKGKPKGKGKQTWGSWQEEKPKGGDAGAPRKEAEK
jgi:hypothetical protein